MNLLQLKEIVHVLAIGHILMEFHTCPGSRTVAGSARVVLLCEGVLIYSKSVME